MLIKTPIKNGSKKFLSGAPANSTKALLPRYPKNPPIIDRYAPRSVSHLLQTLAKAKNPQEAAIIVLANHAITRILARSKYATARAATLTTNTTILVKFTCCFSLLKFIAKISFARLKLTTDKKVVAELRPADKIPVSKNTPKI